MPYGATSGIGVCVSLSCMLDSGNITGCKEVMSKFTHLEGPSTTSQWEGLLEWSAAALVVQYLNVLRNSVPAVVYPRAKEYKISAKVERQTVKTVWRAAKSLGVTG